MSIVITAEPDRADLFTPSVGAEAELIDPAVAPLADRLRTAYVRRVAAYHQDLMTAYGSEAYEQSEVRESSLPRVALTGDEPEVVVIDSDLFANLFELYICDGWAPIRQLEAELFARAGSPERSNDESGTRGQPYLVAYRFFLFCRNMLAVLIREALVELERRAGVRMIAQTSVAAVKVSSALTKEFGVTQTKVVVTPWPTPLPYDGAPDQEYFIYSIANQPLLTTLAAALEDAVKQRIAFEELLDRIAQVKDLLRRVDNNLAYVQLRGWDPEQSVLEERARLRATEKQQTDLRDATSGYYDAMKEVIGINCPLALLVVDGLKPGFEKNHLEQVLGQVIWQLAERFDALGRGIDPEKSMVGLALAGIEVSSSGWISPESVEKLYVPPLGPEAAIANDAVEELESSPAWFPMLHETTWRLLVQQGEIVPDSLEYVVMQHYLDALDEKMAEKAQAAAKSAAFWQMFGKVSSALAVALLVTPLAEFAPALVGVSAVADLALVAWQISSVTRQLAQLDQALTATLLEPDAYATPSLGRLGELMIARGEFVREVGNQLLIEFIGIMAAGQWATVRKLMIARGFLMDMETILGIDNTDD
jgi:hypothetical protein